MVNDYSLYDKKHLKRDYYNKTFSNPYFNRKEKRKSTFNTKLYVEVLTVIFLIYLVIYSGILQVKEIEFRGLEMIDNEEIKQKVEDGISGRRWLIFPAGNLIFIRSNKIKSLIEKDYSLERLKINKGWQKLTIDLEEKIVYLIVKNSQSYYFIDSFGYVFKELSANDLNNHQQRFPILHLDRELKVGEQEISGRMVNYVIELDKIFKDKKIEIKHYESREVDQVIVYTQAGWQAYFSINNSLSLSIENMMLVLERKLVNRKFDYIDLRFGDRVLVFPE